MFEKVNPFHPDKLADRIAGAIVDYAYTLEDNPKVAAEVLVGHGLCSIIVESSVIIPLNVIKSITKRILGVNVEINYKLVPQDKHLADNQANGIACGDNGIFKGMPITQEQQQLADFASMFETDGKYIINGDTLICCQSCCENAPFWYGKIIFNPLGYWTGGIEVDSGATNRKLGSDMGDAVTGGGQGVVVTDNYIQWHEEGLLKVDTRAWKPDKFSGTLTTKAGGQMKVCEDFSNLRIRKLTPRECGRLMGVRDEDIDKIMTSQSKNKAYHLFGDSIVVNVLMAIFKELL